MPVIQVNPWLQQTLSKLQSLTKQGTKFTQNYAQFCNNFDWKLSYLCLKFSKNRVKIHQKFNPISWLSLGVFSSNIPFIFCEFELMIKLILHTLIYHYFNIFIYNLNTEHSTKILTFFLVGWRGCVFRCTTFIPWLGSMTTRYFVRMITLTCVDVPILVDGTYLDFFNSILIAM